MAEPRDAIYLSPHLDDVVLSCGGQIAARARRGEPVVVLTLFAGDEPPPPHSDLAIRLHGLFGLGNRVVEHRRREDREACALLGAESKHAGLEEAIYRRDVDGDVLYTTLGSLFGRPRSHDRATLESLTELLSDLPSQAEIVAPLGVGGHVDHQLTRSAAELACTQLSYYEETPYAEKWGKTRRALGRRADWESMIASFETEDVDAKIAACFAYGSQIRALYRTPERLDRAIRRRAKKLGGERLWKRAG